MPFLHRDNVSIYYEVHGQVQSPPMLLTHGFTSTCQMWTSQIPLFSKTHRLIIWDMRGHGQSDSPRDQNLYSQDHTIADMLALIDLVVGPDQTVIVGGLSLGGYMSLGFYRCYPERVRSLLVIDTGPGFKRDQAREEWNEYAFRTAEGLERDGLKGLEGQSAERAKVRHRDGMGLVFAARGMLTQWNADVIDSLTGIDVPTLIVVGEEDRPFLAAASYMAVKIKGARKVVIPGAGHAVNIDQPERFNEAVLSFLKQDHGGSGSKL